ncbi:MAG: hypothetical protein C0392_03815 [Syntrophus sp. (in: bacteria)]|nr:hypothetical protein [Syntrophus sp. (in: bacteria)]
MGRAIKILVWATGFIALFSIIGFFVVPPVMKSVLIKKLSENLNRDVFIKQIKVNPYTLSVSVKGIAIKNRGKTETFVSLDELFINASIASVFKRAIIIKELRIAGPYVRIIRNNDESYNFTDLITPKERGEGAPKKPLTEKKAKPLLFSVNNIVISAGSIDFFDGPKKVQHTIKDMNIAIPFISNIKHYVNTYVQPSFSAHINGAPYILTGKAKPFAEPRETNLDIDIKNLDFPQYMAYLPIKPNFILRSGSMDLMSRISFVQPKDKAPSLVITGDIALKNIAVDDLQKHPVLRLPSITASISSIEPLLKSAHLSKVVITAPDLNVKREKDGSINLASLVAEEKKTPQKGVSSKKAPANVSSRADSKTPAKTTAKTDEVPPFKASVDEFLIEKGKASFRDLAAPHPVDVSVTDLNLKCENISTAKENKGALALSLALNKKGTISAKGPFAIDPVSADLAIDLKRIDIRPFQPYFTDKVKINTTSGYINTAGKVTISIVEKTGLKAKFMGKVLMADFASVDKLNGDDFLKWKALSLSSMDVGYNPLYVHIGAVSLADFYARVTLNPDGTLSLRKIVEEEGEVQEGVPVAAAAGTEATVSARTDRAAQIEKAGAKPEKDQDIIVGNITLQGGTIDFMDKAIKPPYSVNLTEMTGRITGFSLKLDQRADLELRGKINHQVPLEILGKINPKKDNLFTDVTVRFRDLDLSAMTPYSGKYLGYKIAKGNLSIDLKYLIEKRKLDSGNVILIDQLTLGDKVESPDAVKLPLGLALALLKDRKGQINLDIPVSGSLDDPKFSVWNIVFKVLLNLITKAATAPFALIGSLFGGGEELSYVEFDYGKSALSQGSDKKIETIVKALYERPALKLDMEGHVDMDKDREALKTYLFNKKLKAQKLNTLIKKGSPAVPVDDVVIEQVEYERYLTMAYKVEKFEKPKNVIGFAKTLPAPEMEKLMYAQITVSDGDLRTLATQRTGRVKDAILASGKVTTDRLFVIEPKSLAPEKKDKAKDSRVDFRLK